MAPVRQSLHELRREPALHRDGPVPKPLPARGIQRLLGIHVEVDHIHHDLYVALGLHISAHDAEWAYGMAILHQKAGDDRVIGFLSRHQTVGILRV